MPNITRHVGSLDDMVPRYTFISHDLTYLLIAVPFADPFWLSRPSTFLNFTWLLQLQSGFPRQPRSQAASIPRADFNQKRLDSK